MLMGKEFLEKLVSEMTVQQRCPGRALEHPVSKRIST